MSVRVTIQPPGLLPHGSATAPTISQPHATRRGDINAKGKNKGSGCCNSNRYAHRIPPFQMSALSAALVACAAAGIPAPDPSNKAATARYLVHAVSPPPRSARAALSLSTRAVVNKRLFVCCPYRTPSHPPPLLSGAQHIPSPLWCLYVVGITPICLTLRGWTVSKRGRSEMGWPWCGTPHQKKRTLS